MYLYIYDSFLSDSKYESLLTSIERRVTDLGIQGKIAKLSILKNITELVTDAVKKGVTTIVAIGDDQTFTKMINVVASLNVTFGIIPVVNNSTIAKVLGIPPKERACEVIAARMIRKLDLGKINNYYFIAGAELTNAKISISCDTYSLSPTTEFNTVRICNVGFQTKNAVSNPTDGILEAIITPVKSGMFSKKPLPPTILPFKKIRLKTEGEDASIVTDGQVILKTPAVVEVEPAKLKFIVGSGRLFE